MRRIPAVPLFRTLVVLAACAHSAALRAPSPAGAQEPYGPLVPAGYVRFGLRGEYASFSAHHAQWTEGDRRVSGVRALSADFRGPVGARALPRLAQLESALAGATGERFAASLGFMSSAMEKGTVRTPLAVDVGVFDWLTVGASMPWERPETEFSFVFHADSTNANAGVSPGVADPGTVSGFISSLQGSIDRFEGYRVRACGVDPSSTTCLDATATRARAQGFREALAAMYASMFAPLGGTPAARALEARLAALGKAFAEAGVDGTPGALPLADAAVDPETWAAILADPAFGVGLTHPLESWAPQWRPGDLEIRVAGRVAEILDADGSPRLTAGAGATFRLPTGTADDPGNPVDAASGDGQMDVELRAWMNGRWRDRYGLWADLRYGLQRVGVAERRVFDPAVVFAPSSSQRRLDWNPGDYGFLELAPWYKLAPSLALLAGYRYRTKGADAFSERATNPSDSTVAGAGAPTNAGPDPEILVQGTASSTSELALGMVYDRVAPALGSSARPFEVRIVYRQVVGGSGGNAPRSKSLEVGFRFHFSIWEPGPGS